MSEQGESELLTLTADIVAAHVSNNSVAVNDLPNLIQNVHSSLAGIQGQSSTPEPRPEPKVSVRASVKPDYIVCLEDGKKLKMLKRHLMTHYNMTPDQYRQKWGLSTDYPMVAPNYAEQRRALAKSIGLGTGGRRAGRRANDRPGRDRALDHDRGDPRRREPAGRNPDLFQNCRRGGAGRRTAAVTAPATIGIAEEDIRPEPEIDEEGVRSEPVVETGAVSLRSRPSQRHCRRRLGANPKAKASRNRRSRSRRTCRPRTSRRATARSSSSALSAARPSSRSSTTSKRCTR
jgi:predicted transcriptional regulator